MTSSLTMLTGGVRSGKSAKALALATEQANGKPVLFVATAQAFDDEMKQRIATHKKERAAHWLTLEEPRDVAAQLHKHLAKSANKTGAIVIDCLTLWTSNLLLAMPEDADAESIIASHTRDLLDVLDAYRNRVPAIVVTNEVGLGVVPPTPLGRRYRDTLGRANQLVAASADEVILMVSGIDVVIKRPSS